MKDIYTFAMFAFSVLAFYYATRVFYNKNYKKMSYVLLAFSSVASGIWSIGYSLMFFTENYSMYAFARGIGLLGILLYMIAGQTIMGAFTNSMKKVGALIVGEAILGIVVFIIYLNEKNYRLINTEHGIISEFTNTSTAIIYTLYMIAVVVIFIVLSHKMRRNPSKQIKAVANTFLRMEVLILLGMVIDTLLPAFGINFNIPASTLLQFGGLQLLYRAVHQYNVNSLSFDNIALYIDRYINTAIIVFDKDHHLVIANAVARASIGVNDNQNYRDYDIWGKFFKLDPPDNIAESEDEIVLDTSLFGGRKIVQLCINPVFNNYKDYLGYILIVNDVTEHTQNVQLMETAQAKTAFLANMSHEIRTPLNAILGFNDAIMQNAEDGAKVINYSRSIHEAGENLKDIINSILDISKIEMGQLTITNNEYNSLSLFDNVASMFELLAKKKGLSFVTEIDEDIPEIMLGDEPHLRQILVNILSNAVKYTDEGSVTFKVQVVNNNPTLPTTRIRFSIKDTGRGIREEDREKLFKKFERLDTEHFKHTEGTGLGMNIVQLTLREMGSEIHFDSVFGEGSEFYFELEQVTLNRSAIGDFEKRRKELAYEELKSLDFRAPKAKILIVDDVAMNIDAAIALLEFTQIQIDRASSGREAIGAVKNKRYDIIFMDHMMPEMDGIEATKCIRELSVSENDPYYASVPIVALTANAIAGVQEMYQNAGMQDFVSKPIESNTIVNVFKKWLPSEVIERASQEEILEAENKAASEWEPLNPEKEIPTEIDMQEVKSYNVNFEGFVKNLKSFEREYDLNSKDISKHFENRDAENYVIRVHGLKSTSKMIGAMEVSEKAKELEAKGKAGIMDEADYKQLMSLYEGLVKNIREYLRTEDEDSSESTDIISDEDYRELIGRVKTAADSFDAMGFMELEEELRAVNPPENKREELEDIINLVAALSFGAVSEKLS